MAPSAPYGQADVPDDLQGRHKLFSDTANKPPYNSLTGQSSHSMYPDASQIAATYRTSQSGLTAQQAVPHQLHSTHGYGVGTCHPDGGRLAQHESVPAYGYGGTPAPADYNQAATSLYASAYPLGNLTDQPPSLYMPPHAAQCATSNPNTATSTNDYQAQSYVHPPSLTPPPYQVSSALSPQQYPANLPTYGDPIASNGMSLSNQQRYMVENDSYPAATLFNSSSQQAPYNAAAAAESNSLYRAPPRPPTHVREASAASKSPAIPRLDEGPATAYAGQTATAPAPSAPLKGRYSSQEASFDKVISTLAKNTDNRIDVQQIPRPSYREMPTEPGGRRIEADHSGAPPPSTAFCTYVEDVDAIPRYLRSSLLLVPQSRQTFNTSKIPFFMVSCPFAALNTYECRPPRVDLSPFSPLFTQLAAPRWSYRSQETFEARPGPPRCSGCASYVNAYWQFSSNHATCPMCGRNTELPSWYANALAEHRGIVRPETEADFRKSLRTRYNLNEANDIFNQNLWCRPELLRGTIDYATHAHHHTRLRPPPFTANPDTISQAAAALLQNTSPHRTGVKSIADPPLPYQGAGYEVESSSPSVPSDSTLFLDPSQGMPPKSRIALVYAVEISHTAVKSRFTQSALASIRTTLRQWPETTVDLAIILYNDSLCFSPVHHKRGSDKEEVDVDSSRLRQRHIVGDIESPFIPDSAQSLFLTIMVGTETEDPQLATYFEGLEEVIEVEGRQPAINESCCIAAIAAAIEALVSREKELSTPALPLRGGCICLFTSSHATIGLGALTTFVTTVMRKASNRSSVGAVSGTPAASQKEKTGNIFLPRREVRPVYSELYRRCCTHGIAVHSFVAGGLDHEKKLDLASLGYLPLYTGGQTFYYPHFTTRDYHNQMYFDLFRLFSGPVAFDCAFKIRVSKGLNVTRILCPWSCVEWESGGAGRDGSTFMVPYLGPESSMCFEINYTENQLDLNRNSVIVQTACAYTSWTGERRLRVSTRKLGMSNSLMTTFRHADIEPVVMGFARQMFLACIAENSKMRETIGKQLTEMLYSYRINAAINSPTGQLILPESLKLLPIFLTGLYKSKALRMYYKDDERVSQLFALLSAGSAKLQLGLYPIVIPLHRSYTEIPRENLAKTGLPTDVENFVYVPPSIPSSGERITTDGIYLVDNGESFYIYVGKDVKNSVLEEVISPDTDIASAPVFTPPTSDAAEHMGNRILAVLNQLRLQKFNQGYQSARLIKAGYPPEAEFIWQLVEDRLGSEKGYVDFLCQLHRTVQQMMDDS